jgi:hypothetical protein
VSKRRGKDSVTHRFTTDNPVAFHGLWWVGPIRDAVNALNVHVRWFRPLLTGFAEVLLSG